MNIFRNAKGISDTELSDKSVGGGVCWAVVVRCPRNIQLLLKMRLSGLPETDPTVKNLSSAFHFESGKFASF